jgi:predicted AAA+ superfamily ATPase
VAKRRRYPTAAVRRDLAKKMVFVGGPRQVGKSTFARSLPRAGRGYLSWDDPDDRTRILQRELPTSKLWIFDELHKYRRWRNYLKGICDKKPRSQQILVTGSARLDFYRFGGDSLQGRYHYFRMHPLSVAELGIDRSGDLADLLALGGFPEPFFSGSEAEARRWSRQNRTRLVREEVSELEQIHDLGTLELLAMRLPELVGSPLSINGLREDLQVSHKTAAKWLDVLERLYAIFRIAPFGAPKIRAVKKELRFFRDVDRREVDFVVTEARKPILFVECKWGDDPVDRGLRYLVERFPGVEAWQISATGERDYKTGEGIRVAPALVRVSLSSRRAPVRGRARP